MHCAAIVANVPRKKHLRALRRDYCTIVAEKSCAHCAAIIVQYGREKVVRIVPRAEKIFPTYFSISLQDFLTINRVARHCLCCFISKQRGNPWLTFKRVGRRTWSCNKASFALWVWFWSTWSQIRRKTLPHVLAVWSTVLKLNLSEYRKRILFLSIFVGCWDLIWLSGNCYKDSKITLLRSVRKKKAAGDLHMLLGACIFWRKKPFATNLGRFLQLLELKSGVLRISNACPLFEKRGGGGLIPSRGNTSFRTIILLCEGDLSINFNIICQC